MASVAIIVVELSAGGLFGIEAEFGVRFAALNVTSGEGQKRENDQGDTKRREKAVRDVHDEGSIGCKTELEVG